MQTPPGLIASWDGGERVVGLTLKGFLVSNPCLRLGFDRKAFLFKIHAINV